MLARMHSMTRDGGSLLEGVVEVGNCTLEVWGCLDDPQEKQLIYGLCMRRPVTTNKAMYGARYRRSNRSIMGRHEGGAMLPYHTVTYICITPIAKPLAMII